MLATLAIVTLLAAVPGISLRVIEEGSPAGPPGAWVLGEEVVSAWDVSHCAMNRDGLVFWVPRDWRIESIALDRIEVALVVTTATGEAAPILRAPLRRRLDGDDDLAPDTARVALDVPFFGVSEHWRVTLSAGARAADRCWLEDPRLIAAVSRIEATGRLRDALGQATERAKHSVDRDGHLGRFNGAPQWSKPPAPLFHLEPHDVRALEPMFTSELRREDLLRWWREGPEPLRPLAIAALAAYHAPSCLDLLLDEAVHAPSTERRGRARLALAAAGDVEQAAYFRARLVNDAGAAVGVVEAALALAVLGDVGALDGVRAVAAVWNARDERVDLAVRALEQTLAARAIQAR